jgi:hypothetical protein
MAGGSFGVGGMVILGRLLMDANEVGDVGGDGDEAEWCHE